MVHFPAVNCRSDHFIKSRKKSFRFSSSKRLTKIFSWKLNYPIYSPFINIFFFEMSFQLILSPLFLKPHPTHLISWSNMLIKMKCSKQVLILVLQIWLSRFWPLLPVYNLWKQWKPFSFLVFSGDIKWTHWLHCILLRPLQLYFYW